MQTQTVLTSHETKTGSSQKGPWTMHLFTGADNQKYKTFDQNTANKAYGLLNQPVVLTFEQKQRGQYVDNELIDVAAAAGGNVVPIAAAQQAAPSPSGDDKELRIMRQSALARAIEACAAGVYEPANGVNSVVKLADWFLGYFQNGSEKDDGVPF